MSSSHEGVREDNGPLDKADCDRSSPDPFPPARYQILRHCPVVVCAALPKVLVFIKITYQYCFQDPSTKGRSSINKHNKGKGKRTPMSPHGQMPQYKYRFTTKNEQHFFHFESTIYN